ncbi:MAG: exodeoxyribonuclease VII small subunit [Coriobacteriia bacterium]|nr:exodeoxyribonuclease VII small subunit [Coriobacteriia bacterium]
MADQTFAEGITELEAIVHDLESGNLELETSLTSYERGVELIKELQTKLETAQQKVTTLLGDVDPAPVEGEEELMS